jgi:hypothetical protein
MPVRRDQISVIRGRCCLIEMPCKAMVLEKGARPMALVLFYILAFLHIDIKNE